MFITQKLAQYKYARNQRCENAALQPIAQLLIYQFKSKQNSDNRFLTSLCRNTLFCLLIILSIGVSLNSAHAILPDQVISVLNERKFNQSNISVVAYDITADKMILEHNPDVSRNPASVAKLLTTAIALDIFGPEHRFATELRSYGTPDNGKLHDHLIIKGYGDPNISSHSMTAMVNGLSALGISEITGNLLVDDTYFDLTNENTQPLDENIYSGYNAIPSATMMNQQAISIKIKVTNSKAKVTTVPPMAGIPVINELKTVNIACNKSRYSYEPIIESSKVSIRVWGKYSRHCKPIVFKRIGIPPVWLLGQNFTATWHSHGNKLTGNILQVINNNYTLGAQVLYKHLSVPLSEILAQVNKYSNNPKARSLFLSIGSIYNATPSKPSESRQIIEEWFHKKLGLLTDTQFIDNGSGLSRITKITANNLSALLSYIAKQDYFPAFQNSLPIMGIDGTLKRRMRSTPLEGAAWMKTGSIRGVKALAGYMQTKQGHLLAVSILHEEPRVSQVSANPAHESLLNWLYKNF